MGTKSSCDDYSHAILIADRLWWVGHLLDGDDFQCHAYLLENGTNSVLFDPGSALTWNETRRKIEEIIPLENIAYVVCHHQDPDITASLRPFVEASGRKDLQLVTHWRAAALIKHIGLDLDIYEVQSKDWTLDLGERKLTFIFTPYLHFAGAFCTLDEATGTLLSSDLFGGFTEGHSLYLENEDSFSGIEAFHEHYMPGREFLLKAMLDLENYPIKLIAPQHGLIIREKFIYEICDRLKNLECGLFLLQSGGDSFGSLQIHNRVLKETMSSLVKEKDFSAIANCLSQGLRNVIAVSGIAFIAPSIDKKQLVFTPENRFHGAQIEHLLYHDLMGLTPEELAAKNYNNILIPVNSLPSIESSDVTCKQGYLIPLFSEHENQIIGLTEIRIDHQVNITDEIIEILHRLSKPLAVSLDREVTRFRLEKERDSIYEQSIRDPLTNLFTRRYMEDVAYRMMMSHERGQITGMAALMIDIDHFKHVNDTYGHPIGDVVIQKLANILMNKAREVDLPVRFGGEEFVFFIIVDNSNDATTMAERLRSQIEAEVFESENGAFKITISIGVACHNDEQKVSDLIGKADRALYEAKNSGRNRVVMAEEVVVNS